MWDVRSAWIARKDMENHKKPKMDNHLMMMQVKLIEMPQFFQSTFENVLVRTKNDLPAEFSATRNQLTAATNCQTDQDLATATTDVLPSTNQEVTNELLTSTSHPSTTSDEHFEPRQLSSIDDELCAAVAEKDMTAQNKFTTQKQLVEISNEISAIKEEMYAIKRLTEQTLDIQTKFISEVKSIQDKQHQKMSKFEATLQCVAQQVQLDPWDLRLRTNSANGICPMIIMIDNIDNKKRHNIKWLTDPFYTHDKMYKMCLHVIINRKGHCEGTHLSVLLYLMKGTHDTRLQSSLMGNFVVTLLNQKTDDHHHSRRFTEMVPLAITNSVWQNEMAHACVGCNDFISHKDFTNTSSTCQYLKDDCIFIKVEATVSSRNPQPKPSIINY